MYTQRDTGRLEAALDGISRHASLDGTSNDAVRRRNSPLRRLGDRPHGEEKICTLLEHILDLLLTRGELTGGTEQHRIPTSLPRIKAAPARLVFVLNTIHESHTGNLAIRPTYPSSAI
jgi:hypothetical protein